MNIDLNNDWNEILKEEFNKDYFKNIEKFLDEERKHYNVYPKECDMFNALKYTSYKDTKVVIIGQDPYHEEGEAHGLCFSVNKDIKIPPSLKNIYKELNDDLNLYIPNNGYLKKWADQGVLLINAVLSVREGNPASHSKIGWQNYTDEIIRKLNEKDESIVFILWGNYARSKKDLITNKKHLVLEGVHPSPLSASRGFFGCKHFSMTNNYLKKNNQKEIDWQIENI
ncbi:MAG: uracil-DNA glycosylase [Clostridia bacterium]|nr:uracil-DNA glycosylase [Clostridia bacterium]